MKWLTLVALWKSEDSGGYSWQIPLCLCIYKRRGIKWKCIQVRVQCCVACMFVYLTEDAKGYVVLLAKQIQGLEESTDALRERTSKFCKGCRKYT